MSYFNSSNSKMKALRKKHAFKRPIKTFGLPAIKTCPQAGDCKRDFADYWRSMGVDSKKRYYCFATQGAYTWPAVKAAYERRLKHSKDDMFVFDIFSEIQRCKTTHVRLHDSGDFYSDKYLWKWIQVMRECPDTAFWCYTKSVSRFKKFEERGLMPDNFFYVYSMGGKEDHLIHPAKDRYSKTIKPDRVDAFKHLGFKDLTDDEIQILNRDQKLFYTVAH